MVSNHKIFALKLVGLTHFCFMIFLPGATAVISVAYTVWQHFHYMHVPFLAKSKTGHSRWIVNEEEFNTKVTLNLKHLSIYLEHCYTSM